MTQTPHRALLCWHNSFTAESVADARLHHVQVDEDADDLSFPAMVSQLFEFVLCIVSNSTFLPLLQPVLPELIYLTIGGKMHPLLHACL